MRHETTTSRPLTVKSRYLKVSSSAVSKTGFSKLSVFNGVDSALI